MISSSQSSLFLCGESPTKAPNETASLVTILADLGLLRCESDSKNSWSSTAYAVGDNYYHLISLVGCSPVALLDAAQAANPEQVTRIGLSPVWKQPVLIYGSNTKTPTCPHCKNKLTDWREQVSMPDALTVLSCSSCKQSSEIATLFRNKTAGYTRFAIEVTNVYPREAIPTDALLQTLAEFMQQPVRYFYCEAPLHSFASES